LHGTSQKKERKRVLKRKANGRKAGHWKDAKGCRGKRPCRRGLWLGKGFYKRKNRKKKVPPLERKGGFQIAFLRGENLNGRKREEKSQYQFLGLQKGLNGDP